MAANTPPTSDATPPPTLERLTQLLADQATAGLTPEQQRERDELLNRFPHVDPLEMELAAAAADLALTPDWPSAPPLDPALTRAIEARAFRTLRIPPPPGPVTPRRRWLLPTIAATGWLATAACLLILTGLIPTPAGRERPVESAALPARQLDAQLQAEADTRTYRGSQGSRGGVIRWNGRLQQGVMEWTGLPANDPARRQYQLWIIDASRPDSPPVDGGVFDLQGGEALLPIRAKLPVGDAVAFAVTEEVPGGVVVSRNEKLVVLAP